MKLARMYSVPAVSLNPILDERALHALGIHTVPDLADGRALILCNTFEMNLDDLHHAHSLAFHNTLDVVQYYSEKPEMSLLGGSTGFISAFVEGTIEEEKQRFNEDDEDNQ